MAKDYSEDQLIQKSIAELMEKELGWKSIYAFDQETLGANGTLGQTSFNEALTKNKDPKSQKRFLGHLVNILKTQDKIINEGKRWIITK